MSNHSAPGIQQFCEAVLAAVGCRETDAQTVAESLVDAEVRNVRSHGVALLPRFARGVAEGLIVAAPIVSVIKDRAAVAVMDAGNGLGPIGAAAGMSEAALRARRFGVGIATVRNSNHFGAGSYFVRRISSEGLIGILITNTVPLMGPPDAPGRVVGNNPIVVGVPGPNGLPDIVYDASLAEAAFTRVRAAERAGEPIPESWAMAADGSSTTDPAEVLAGGSLRPIGGHKGFGLAVVNEVLVGVLSGSALLGDIGWDAYGDGRVQTAMNAGHTCICIDPTYFDEQYEIDRRTVALAAGICQPQARGVPRLPGHHSADLASRARTHGVELDERIVGELNQLAIGLGVAELASRRAADGRPDPDRIEQAEPKDAPR